MSATPKTYRKKPVEIEAMQFTGSDHHAVYCWVEDHIPTYCYLSNDHVGVGVSINPANGAFIICTLEGEMTVSDGDYVIRGVQGEFYPCKSGIFEATYEPLAPSNEQRNRMTETVRHWAEVSDPIVWDGSDEAFEAIRAALGHGVSGLRVYKNGPDYAEWLEIEDGRTLDLIGHAVPNARIRIEGDSFAILPPEVES